MFKRWVVAAFCGTMVLSMTACQSSSAEKESQTGTEVQTEKESQTEGKSSAAGIFTAGTYSGTSEHGKNGSITVEVKVSENTIESVVITEHQETPGLSDPAIERIPKEILDTQSLAVDGVTGATITCDAILEAVGDALTKAGADLESLKMAKETSAEKEIVEINTDVVIVGGGATGMAAAISSAQNGAEDVILLEKTAAVGGNAIVSGGFLEYISAPDELRPEMTDGYRHMIENVLEAEPVSDSYALFQKTLGEEYEAYKAGGSTKVFDSRTWLTLDYLRYEPESAPEAMMSFATLLDDTTQWFTDMGMEWKPLTGIVGYTWPRWSSPKNGFAGHGYFELFERTIKENNYPIEIMLETAGKELITEDGKVTGVIAESRDKEYHITSDKGVVLATGGFAANIDMVLEYNEIWDSLDDTIKTTNASGVTGDGIKMAEAVGAALENMGDIMLFPNADPYSSTTENIVGNDGDALYVNKEGVRFVNETLDRYSISGEVLKQTDRLLYIISDTENSRISNGKTFNGFDVEEMIQNGQLFRADTLEELAEQLNMEPEVLTGTVDTYNKYAANYKDEEFDRISFSDNSQVDKAPFYACPRTVATHITGGGLLTDENYNVLDTNGKAIEGLYSGGEINAYMSGISSFGDGMYIGQILFGE